MLKRRRAGDCAARPVVALREVSPSCCPILSRAPPPLPGPAVGVFSLTVAGLELLDADSTHPKMAGEFANAPTLLSGLTDEFGAPSSESRGGLIGALSNGGDLVCRLLLEKKKKKVHMTS